AGPAAWQWHVLDQARAQQQAFRHTLRTAAADLAQLQTEIGQEQRRLEAAREATARLQSALSRRRAESARIAAGADAALYRWSEESEYVRVPKAVLSQIALAEEPQTPQDQRSWEDTARPVLRRDGTFSAGVVAALDLSPNQVEALRDTLAGFSQQFDLTAQKYSLLTNAAPDLLGFYATGGPNGESRTLYTAAFPEEGAQLETQLRDSLNTLLGSERAGIFWQQARHDLNYRFNRFGKSPKAVTLVRLPTEYPPFYARGQVRDGTYMEEESRNAFFHTKLPPAWAGFQPRLLPAEFYGWWPDLSPTQSPPGVPASLPTSSHD
ncbi:MAG TPA: hypothetical protein VNZ22_07110, partial [Bacillota bacterium]|nr:hypothetical protein [Bacillota bacterium]